MRAPLPLGAAGPSRRYYVETWEGDRWVATNFVSRRAALEALAVIGRYRQAVYARVRARLNDGRTLRVKP